MPTIIQDLEKDNVAISLKVSGPDRNAYDHSRILRDAFTKGGSMELDKEIVNRNLENFVVIGQPKLRDFSIFS